MRTLFLNGLLIGAMLCLSSCDKGSETGGKLNKGQVIASVNGNDITIYELSTELQGVNLPSGEARKRIQQAALQKIIERKILAGIARDRKLDKTPQYLLETRRADEMLLVNLLQQNTASKVPEPSSEDVDNFITANPWMFRDRKLLIIDQIQFPMPSDHRALAEYQPLKTLDEIEQKLIEQNVDYRRVPASLDTLQLPAQIAKSIVALPPGEVFVVPSNGNLTANRITEVRSTPLTGAEAKRLAKDLVRKQRMTEKATAELGPLLNDARSKISYQDGYEPSKTNSSSSKASSTVTK